MLFLLQVLQVRKVIAVAGVIDAVATALPGFFFCPPLVRWGKSFLCNPSQIRNEMPSLNRLWLKPGLCWTLPDSIEFVSAPTLFQRIILAGGGGANKPR